MGIKLKELITSNIIDFSELKGKIIAIDAPNIISSLLKVSKKNVDHYSNIDVMIDRTQRPISHLYGLLYRIVFYYSKIILPIFCFDGRDSDLKRVITKDLLNDYIYSRTMYEQAMMNGQYYEARNIAFGKDYFWPNIIKESKKLLYAMGVPIIESPASAESQCAQLIKDHVAHYSNSQDYDSLLFGCPRTIQNLSKSRRRKLHGRWQYENVEPRLINLKENLNQLGINQFQLVDMALLIGTDYFPGIRGIGPKKALKFIKKYGELEKIIIKEQNFYDFSSLTHDIITQVRKIFLLPETANMNNLLFWNRPSETRIKYLLCEDHNLNEKRVMDTVQKLTSNYKHCLNSFKKQRLNKPSFQKKLCMVL